MKIDQLIMRTVIVVLLVLVAWLPVLPTLAADQPSEGTTALASSMELRVMAAGAVEDTLKACLARIPKDASDGQRMLAEQGCQQDEATRKLVQTAPAF